MDMGPVIDAVEAKLRAVPSVLSVHFLVEDLNAQIRNYETTAEKTGPPGD